MRGAPGPYRNNGLAPSLVRKHKARPAVVPSSLDAKDSRNTKVFKNFESRFRLDSKK